MNASSMQRNSMQDFLRQLTHRVFAAGYDRDGTSEDRIPAKAGSIRNILLPASKPVHEACWSFLGRINTRNPPQ